MISANAFNAVATNYTYDGEGRRVTKSASDVPATTYVYDAAGELVAEYGGPTNGAGRALPARLQDRPGGDGTLLERIRECTRLGRPAAQELFLLQLGNTLGRNLLPRKPGRPRKPVACERVDPDRTARATRRNWKRYGRPGFPGFSRPVFPVFRGQEREPGVPVRSERRQHEQSCN